MLITDEMTYTVDKKQILSPTSASFEPGQLYGVIGHNGSGKSTFIKLLAKQTQCSSGRILLDNRALTAYKTKQFARKVSYLPQYLPSDLPLTVLELVQLGRFPWQGAFKKKTQEDDRIVCDALSKTQTLAYQSQLLSYLSGGERQRVWLAMCLAQQPKYLILDEPLSALDIHHQIEVMKLLSGLAHEHQIAIIVVIHDINLASEYCDMILAFKKGRLIYNQPAHDFLNPTILLDVYGVDFSIIQHPVRSHSIALS